MLTFDLTREPWIPVRRYDDSITDVSLMTALTGSHAIVALADPYPTARTATLRLLLAVLHRVLPGATLDDRAAWYRAGRFDDETVRAIHAYLDQWRERFDLLHADHPWMQDPTLEPKSARGATESPVGRLIPEHITGSSAVLWGHNHDDDRHSLTPARSARALLVGHGYGLSGAMVFTHGVLAQGLRLVTEGETLLHTLLLNSVSDHLATDSVPWERDVETPTRRAARGPADLWTWQGRRLRLLPRSDGRVERVIYAPGDTWESAAERDPGQVLRVQATGPNKGQLLPQRSRIGFALVRDLASSADTLPGDMPAWAGAVHVAELLRAAGVDGDAPLVIRRTGMVTDKARIDTWQHDVVPVTARWFLDDAHRGLMVETIDLATTLGSTLVYATKICVQDYVQGACPPEAIASLQHRIEISSGWWDAVVPTIEAALVSGADIRRELIDLAEPTFETAIERIAPHGGREIGLFERGRRAGLRVVRNAAKTQHDALQKREPRYITEQIANLLGVSSSRIRQHRMELGIGQQRGRDIWYSDADIELIQGLGDRRRKDQDASSAGSSISR